MSTVCKTTVVKNSIVSGWLTSSDSPFPIPIKAGVPTAPNVTAETSADKAMTTAAIGEKPNAIRSGAATVAGVPKPDAPSMNETNNQPTMST